MMSEFSLHTSATIEQSERVPRIVYDSTLRKEFAVDTNEIVYIMRGMAISEETISKTTIYLDAKSHYCVNGSVWPRTLGRMRHIRTPELLKAPGNIVRLSTVMGGKPRRIDDINHTLVHELKHVAQIDHKDKSLIYGHITCWGAAVVGALAANRLVRNNRRSIPRITATLGGLLVGSQAGYSLAAHERHARSSAEHTNTHAISMV